METAKESTRSEDWVQVVRCHDCAYGSIEVYSNGDTAIRCCIGGSSYERRNLDWFCAYGKRREKEIVHCRDCVHKPDHTYPGFPRLNYKDRPDWACPFTGSMRIPDDNFYCEHGERRE